MIQLILVGLSAVAALAYLGRLVYQSFKAKTSCSAGCGKCAESASISKA